MAQYATGLIEAPELGPKQTSATTAPSMKVETIAGFNKPTFIVLVSGAVSAIIALLIGSRKG